MGVTPKTYKKTATIQAIQWENSFDSTVNITNWSKQYGVTIELTSQWSIETGLKEPKLKIPTLEGPMFASVGDFIVKGINDEFWAIKPDIMEKTYEEV